MTTQLVLHIHDITCTYEEVDGEGVEHKQVKPFPVCVFFTSVT